MVVVAEGARARLRRHRPLDNAVVGQFVVEDQILRPEEVAEEGGIRAVATGKHRRPLGSQERGQLRVELVEERVVAPHHPAGRGAAPEAVDRRLGRPGDFVMAGEAEVVEAREADDVTAGDPGGAAADTLVGTEEGIDQPGVFEAAEALLEQRDLRERVGLLPMSLPAPSGRAGLRRHRRGTAGSG